VEGLLAQSLLKAAVHQARLDLLLQGIRQVQAAARYLLDPAAFARLLEPPGYLRPVHVNVVESAQEFAQLRLLQPRSLAGRPGTVVVRDQRHAEVLVPCGHRFPLAP